MSNIKRIGELDIDQDMDLQRKDWKFQHAGRCVMLLLVIAALLGAFGQGWLARAEVGAKGDALWMEYDRIVRHRASTQLKLHLAPQAAANGTMRLWVQEDYLQSVSIESITPEPKKVVLEKEGLSYEFAATEPSQPILIVFDIKPEENGPRSGAIGIVGQKRHSFTQFVLP